MTVPPGLTDENHLVHASRLVLPQEVPDLIGGADSTPEGQQPIALHLGSEVAAQLGGRVPVEAVQAAVTGEFLVDVGDAGTVLTEPVVMGQRVSEKVSPVDATLQRCFLVLVAQERQHARHVWVDGEPRWDAGLRGDDLVILADPLLGLAGLHEGEGQGAHALLGGQVNGLPLAARHP